MTGALGKRKSRRAGSARLPQKQSAIRNWTVGRVIRPAIENLSEGS